MSFLEIGLLFSFREICVNFMEVPSGALADLYGRKSIMLFALSSYIVSFLIFGLAGQIWPLYLAMFFFAIGEAFRTGTHKAIIFDYLRHEGRAHEKTQVYGYTRSWSQKGSALSVLIAAALVFYAGKYEYVFWFTIIPYILGLWNIAMYPSWLNKRVEEGVRIRSIFSHLWRSTLTSVKRSPVRNLIFQSMLFSSQFKALKDYLQAVIKAQVLAVPVILYLGLEKRTAVLVGIVYFIIYMLTSYSSKSSYRFANLFENKQKASVSIMAVGVCAMVVSSLGALFELYWIPILGFIIIYVLQNLFRPILISRFDDCTGSDSQATILSIESQAVSLGVFAVAPLTGYAVDCCGLPAVFLVSSFLLGSYLVLMFVFSRTDLTGKDNQVTGRNNCKD